MSAAAGVSEARRSTGGAPRRLASAAGACALARGDEVAAAHEHERQHAADERDEPAMIAIVVKAPVKPTR